MKFKYVLMILCIVLIVILVSSKGYEYYKGVDPKIAQLKEMLRPMFPDIDSVKIYEGDQSYTINKKTIYLCLYDEDKQYYSDNFLLYVLLHELAHYYNKKDIGHTPEWQKLFDQYLEEAENKKIYDPTQPLIYDYCPGEERSILDDVLDFFRTDK